jgi:maltose alpha-D-glucosyltransferase/alpha-amylase
MENVIDDQSYFKWNTTKSPMKFLEGYLGHYENTKNDGYICFLTDNHDMVRIRKFYEIEELKLFYAFMFLMPGVPFLYYGDEIGMNYLNVPTKEGGYRRTGSRTPMQWDSSKNLGFSTAEKEALYLPVDDSDNAPTVCKNAAEPHSLLNFIKEIIQIRKSDEDLGSKANFELIFASENSKVMIYKRGKFVFFLNPSNHSEKVEQKVSFVKELQRFWGISEEISLDNENILVPAHSFNIYKIK